MVLIQENRHMVSLNLLPDWNHLIMGQNTQALCKQDGLWWSLWSPGSQGHGELWWCSVTSWLHRGPWEAETPPAWCPGTVSVFLYLMFYTALCCHRHIVLHLPLNPILLLLQRWHCPYWCMPEGCSSSGLVHQTDLRSSPLWCRGCKLVPELWLLGHHAVLCILVLPPVRKAGPKRTIKQGRQVLEFKQKAIFN